MTSKKNFYSIFIFQDGRGGAGRVFKFVRRRWRDIEARLDCSNEEVELLERQPRPQEQAIRPFDQGMLESLNFDQNQHRDLFLRPNFSEQRPVFRDQIFRNRDLFSETKFSEIETFF